SGGNGRVAEVRIGFEPPAESGGESAAPARKTGTRFEKWSLSLLLAWRVMARNRSVLEAEWAGEEKNVRLLFTCE
ncbi:MAG TPA: hypothetical protein VLS90_07030, partial [Thermodesulfobacteriota bacterium]|nr:hypothetical protein [Thermodesulfobacteriota bacterium]